MLMLLFHLVPLSLQSDWLTKELTHPRTLPRCSVLSLKVRSCELYGAQTGINFKLEALEKSNILLFTF